MNAPTDTSHRDPGFFTDTLAARDPAVSAAMLPSLAASATRSN